MSMRLMALDFVNQLAAKNGQSFTMLTVTSDGIKNNTKEVEQALRQREFKD